MQMNAKCIRMATTSKQKITSVAESVEKLGPFCLAAVKARWISKPTEGNITEAGRAFRARREASGGKYLWSLADQNAVQFHPLLLWVSPRKAPRDGPPATSQVI